MGQSLAIGRPRKDEATHCSHGHAWTPENTYWAGRTRFCRRCKADARKGSAATVSFEQETTEKADRNMRRALFRYGSRYGLPNMSKLQCIEELRLLDRIYDEDQILAGKIEREMNRPSLLKEQSW